ncbi:hypothetical protein BDW74DRAFT_180086 [Aspergillus multicolor]|uniref:uncharacterized protein n=1 Tax=Aspergillus multicolor TaxID=41759 RepID=UPI003CCD01D9
MTGRAPKRYRPAESQDEAYPHIGNSNGGGYDVKKDIQRDRWRNQPYAKDRHNMSPTGSLKTKQPQRSGNLHGITADNLPTAPPGLRTKTMRFYKNRPVQRSLNWRVSGHGWQGTSRDLVRPSCRQGTVALKECQSGSERHGLWRECVERLGTMNNGTCQNCHQAGRLCTNFQKAIWNANSKYKYSNPGKFKQEDGGDGPDEEDDEGEHPEQDSALDLDGLNEFKGLNPNDLDLPLATADAANRITKLNYYILAPIARKLKWRLDSDGSRVGFKRGGCSSGDNGNARKRQRLQPQTEVSGSPATKSHIITLRYRPARPANSAPPSAGHQAPGFPDSSVTRETPSAMETYAQNACQTSDIHLKPPSHVNTRVGTEKFSVGKNAVSRHDGKVLKFPLSKEALFNLSMLRQARREMMAHLQKVERRIAQLEKNQKAGWDPV